MAFYFADFGDDNIAGAVMWAMLAAFAALEGFYNFCAGCWVFGHLMSAGVSAGAHGAATTAARKQRAP